MEFSPKLVLLIVGIIVVVYLYVSTQNATDAELQKAVAAQKAADDAAALAAKSAQQSNDQLLLMAANIAQETATAAQAQLSASIASAVNAQKAADDAALAAQKVAMYSDTICQLASDTWHINPNYSWGSAPSDVRAWWMANNTCRNVVYKP